MMKRTTETTRWPNDDEEPPRRSWWLDLDRDRFVAVLRGDEGSRIIREGFTAGRQRVGGRHDEEN
jgi:hypothetical protein